MDLGMFTEWEDVLEKLLEEDEEDVQCWYLISLINVYTDNLEGAKETFESWYNIVKKYPDYQAAWEAQLQVLKDEIDAKSKSASKEVSTPVKDDFASKKKSTVVSNQEGDVSMADS